jgi:hypothetical protein
MDYGLYLEENTALLYKCRKILGSSSDLYIEFDQILNNIRENNNDLDKAIYENSKILEEQIEDFLEDYLENRTQHLQKHNIPCAKLDDEYIKFMLINNEIEHQSIFRIKLLIPQADQLAILIKKEIL